MTLSITDEVYSELPEDGRIKGLHWKVGYNSFFCPRLLIGEGVAGRDASIVFPQRLEDIFLKLSQDIKFKQDQGENLLKFVQNGREKVDRSLREVKVRLEEKMRRHCGSS